MSAFIVGKTHLDYLLTFGLLSPRYPGDEVTWPTPNAVPRRQALTFETVDRVGCMLAAENRRSVNYRYRENEIEEVYAFTRYSGPIDPVQVLKSIACYAYQACETDDWESSEAHAFCESLRHHAINDLPGYKDAVWGVPGE